MEKNICAGKSAFEVRFYKYLEKFITVNVSDEASGVIVSGYVCRVFRENVADNLVNRVITFLHKSIVDNSEIFFDFCFTVINRKSHSFIVHNFKNPLFRYFSEKIQYSMCQRG